VKRPAVLWSVAGFSLYLLSLASACGGDGEENPFGVKSEVVAPTGATALAFAPDGRLFYAERLTGIIGIVTADGELLEDPFVQLEDLGTGIEWGLTGLAVDPDFETNHYVYAFYTHLFDPEPPVDARPMVVRFTDEDNRGVGRKVIADDFPEPSERPGLNGNGSIVFGPDGLLYVTVGDYDVGLSQDLSIAPGKMLRVNKEDGSPAPDNPFVDDPDADPRIFTYGFREAFDFTFHPETGQIYGSDNTPGSCEELNLIEAGGNYGWPDVGEFPWPDCFAGGQTRAIHLFAAEGMQPEDYLSPVTVSGKQFVSGDVYPLLGDSLLVCEAGTQLMRRLDLTGASLDEVAADDVVVKDCHMDIAVSPDGIVYYSNEEEIRRLVPVEVESEP
jgi:glucose/arabinose dehydrogenase